MKCLVTETLSGEKDGAMAACVMTLQTTEERRIADTLFLRIVCALEVVVFVYITAVCKPEGTDCFLNVSRR